jgi:hypothetical protein
MEGRLRRLVERGVSKEEGLTKESGADFWTGKTPCWQMCHCPPAIRDECPASKYTSLPCWEIEGTYCKLQMRGNVATGTDTSICEVCRVHKMYGNDKPIELKLHGRGIDLAINSSPERGAKMGIKRGK